MSKNKPVKPLRPSQEVQLWAQSEPIALLLYHHLADLTHKQNVKTFSRHLSKLTLICKKLNENEQAKKSLK